MSPDRPFYQTDIPKEIDQLWRESIHEGDPTLYRCIIKVPGGITLIGSLKLKVFPNQEFGEADNHYVLGQGVLEIPMRTKTTSKLKSRRKISLELTDKIANFNARQVHYAHTPSTMLKKIDLSEERKNLETVALTDIEGAITLKISRIFGEGAPKWRTKLAKNENNPQAFIYGLAEGLAKDTPWASVKPLPLKWVKDYINR